MAALRNAPSEAPGRQTRPQPMRFMATTYAQESSNEPLKTLDKDRAEVMQAWVEALIPGNAHWPSAGQTSAVQHIDAVLTAAPVLRAEVLQAVDVAKAAACQADLPVHSTEFQTELVTILQQLEAAPVTQAAFRTVLELTYEAYYRDPLVRQTVQQRTGYNSNLPLTGVPMEPFDESRLERVKQLPPRFRRI